VGLMGILEHDSHKGLILFFTFIVGLGIGLAVSLVPLAAQNAVGLKDVATATSTVTFFRTIGGAVGVTVFQV
jgi:hypothetical protein